MTLRARGSKHGATAVNAGGVAPWCRTGRVGRELVIRHDVGSPPALLHSLDQHVDLLVRERTAGALRERWLTRPRDADRDDLTHALGGNDGQIDGIVQRPRRAEASRLPVTAGAVPRIERVEGRDSRWVELAGLRPWPTR